MASDEHSENGNDYDPTLPETFDGIYEEFARLRRECPVAHSNTLGGFWAVAKYNDIKMMLDQPLLYTTAYKNVVPVMSLTSRRAPLHLDPPEHTPYRQALDRVCSTRRVKSLEAFTKLCAGNLLDPLIAKGKGDLVRDFSRRMPVEVFSHWMGLEGEQVEVLQATSQAYIDSWEAADLEGVQAAGMRLTKMAEELIADRKQNPRDIEVDPVSSILAARDEGGELLPPDKVVGCIRQVLVVGLVAPPIFIGSMGVHLSRDQALQDKLRNDPSLISAAVEEFLRLYTPYRGFARTARETVTLHGKTITPDEPIAMLYASANRDEEIFDNPDQFILNRPNISKHIAFGLGPHRCAGMPIARQELRIALTELLARTKHFEVCGEIKMSEMPEVGPLSVPMVFEAV